MYKKIKIIFLVTIIYISVTLLSGALCLEKTYAKDYTDYISDEVYNKYYYYQLSEGSKLIYEALLKNVDNTMYGTYEIKVDFSERNVKAGDNAYTVFQSAIDAFDRDHPEIFWIDIAKIEFKYSVRYEGEKQLLNNVYITYNEQYENYLIDSYKGNEDVITDLFEMNYIINENLPYINAFTGKNETYNKIKYIHDILVKNNEYNFNTDNASGKSLKAISAILGYTEGENAPICEGYSRAFKVFCDKLGIPCVIVSGNASQLNGKSVPHMWNYVLVDKFWYAVDVTWDDPVILTGSYDDLTQEQKYQYFMKGSDFFDETHNNIGQFVFKENYEFVFDYPELSTENFYVELPTYSIKFDKIKGGKITTNISDLNDVKAGTVVKLKIEPNEGKEFVYGSLVVNESNYYATSFIMPENDVVISAKFQDIPEINEEIDEDESKPTKEPQKDDNKPIKDSHGEIQETQSPTQNDHDKNEIDSESEDKSDSNSENEVIDGEEAQDILSDYVDYYEKEYKVKVINNSSYNMNDNRIIAGSRNVELDSDMNVYMYNTIYDKADIKNILDNGRNSSKAYSDFCSFSITVFGLNATETTFFDNNGIISMLIPLDETVFNDKYGIEVYRLDNSVLVNQNFNVISLDNAYYLHLNIEKKLNNYTLVYNGPKEDEIVATVTPDFYQNESVALVTVEDSADESLKISKIMIVAYSLVVLIFIVSISFNIYIYISNKKNN